MLIIFCAVVLIGGFFFFDLHKQLSLAGIKAQTEAFDTLYLQHRVLVLVVFFLLYVGVTALSLPGAAVLTLAAGAFLGFWTGLVLVSFASTTGATLACAASRYIFRDFVEKRFGEKLMTVNKGIAKEGAFYLFTLRLIPAIPFFIINLAMGLTKMRLRTFYLVSQVGMLPGTILYINAGRELGSIETMADIVSPGLMISFVLLGVFPLAAKKIVAFVRSRRE